MYIPTYESWPDYLYNLLVLHNQYEQFLGQVLMHVIGQQ